MSSLAVLFVVGVAGCDSSRTLSIDSGQPDAASPDADAPTTPPVDAEEPIRYCKTNDDCSATDFCLLGGCHPGGGGKPRCEKRPEGCDDDWVPVCGCDGATYSNKCYAHAEGVNVASDRECRDGECGLMMHLPACPEGTFCDLAGCDAASGTCVANRVDGDCEDFDGTLECGCDAKTYTNSCWRQLAGVRFDHDGSCDAE